MRMRGRRWLHKCTMRWLAGACDTVLRDLLSLYCLHLRRKLVLPKGSDSNNIAEEVGEANEVVIPPQRRFLSLLLQSQKSCILHPLTSLASKRWGGSAKLGSASREGAVLMGIERILYLIRIAWFTSLIIHFNLSANQGLNDIQHFFSATACYLAILNDEYTENQIWHEWYIMC